MFLTIQSAYSFVLQIEGDPFPYVFDGSSLAFSVKPSNDGHWSIWAAQFEMNLPDEMIGLVKDNQGKGFTHRITPSRGASLDYGVNTDSSGFYFGLGGFKIINQISLGTETQEFAISYKFFKVGYSWFFWDRYSLNLWVSAGPQSITEGSNKIGNDEYIVESFRILGGPHFAVTF